MAGGKHWTRSWETGSQYKGALLSADERRKARELRGRRFPPLAIARALGRSLPDVTDYLNSPEAEGGL